MSRNKLPRSDLAALAKGKGFGFVPVEKEPQADEFFVPLAQKSGFEFISATPSGPALPRARRAGQGDRRLPGGKKAAIAPENVRSKRLPVGPGGLVSGRPEAREEVLVDRLVGIAKRRLILTQATRLQVDRRVGIALSVLPAKDRRLVERVIRSRRVFDGLLAKSADIQELETSGCQLFRMAVSPNFHLIFTLCGDTVCIEDVVETATLRHFGDRKAIRPV